MIKNKKYCRLKCPKCDADFGQESRFRDHLTDTHGIDDYESLYVQLELLGLKPTCGCGCGESLPWIGWKKGYTSKYLRGHNASVDSIYLNKERQKEFVAKRVEGYKSGRNKVWNKGLSKETDERIRSSAENISKSLNKGYLSGSIIDWHTTDPKKAEEANRKASQTKRQKFADGDLVPWNKGLTKQTSSIMLEISKKISETMISNPSSSARRFKLSELQELIVPALKTGKFELLTDLSTYRNRHQILQLCCQVCHNTQEKNLMMLLSTPVCFSCHKKESKGQLELYEFVKSLAPDAVLSDRNLISPKEIDVLVPGKLGIEYDGLYWHSVRFLDPSYATQKLAACDAVGLSLLRVFEDDWRDKRPIVESMIKHRLGFSDQKIGARKCKIIQLDSKVRREFFDANHLDGDTRSTTAWGLSHGDKLVAAISVRRPFHKKHGDKAEIGRFCSIINHTVPGALSRLTQVAIDWAKKEGKVGLMTYVDRRIGSAQGYISAGYKVLRETKSRFWWTDSTHRYDRFKYKANSSLGLTQAQVAEEAGVVQIWGCPNVVLFYDVNSE